MTALTSRERAEMIRRITRQLIANDHIEGFDPGSREYSRSNGIDWSAQVFPVNAARSIWKFSVNDELVEQGTAVGRAAAVNAIIDAYEKHVVRENPPMSTSRQVRVPYTLVRADWEPENNRWTAGVADIEVPASFAMQGSLVLNEWDRSLRGMIGGSDAIYDIVEDETLRKSDTAKVRAILKRGAKENLTGYAGTVIAGMFSIAALNGKVIGGYGPTKATVETESIYVRPGCHPLGQLPVGAWWTEAVRSGTTQATSSGWLGSSGCA